MIKKSPIPIISQAVQTNSYSLLGTLSLLSDDGGENGSRRAKAVERCTAKLQYYHLVALI
jgi:hypothetical protein